MGREACVCRAPCVPPLWVARGVLQQSRQAALRVYKSIPVSACIEDALLLVTNVTMSQCHRSGGSVTTCDKCDKCDETTKRRNDKAIALVALSPSIRSSARPLVRLSVRRSLLGKSLLKMNLENLGSLRWHSLTSLTSLNSLHSFCSSVSKISSSHKSLLKISHFKIAI